MDLALRLLGLIAVTGLFARVQATMSTEPPTVSHCEPITASIPTCINVCWQNTSFPNLLGHKNQEEAYKELQDFDPLIEAECSNKVVYFFCAVYAPICLPTSEQDDFITLLPCKHLCEVVRADCEQLLVGNGSSWPTHLDCHNFPSDGICLNVSDSVTTPDIPGLNLPDPPTMVLTPSTSNAPSAISELPTAVNESISSTPSSTTASTCEPITEAIPICINVGWTNTSFPNLREHISQKEAYEELDDFIPLIEQQCSNKLVYLLCAVYTPFCLQSYTYDHEPDNIIILQPCKELCGYVRADCEPLLNSAGYDWPEHLDCDNFPPENSSTSVCLNVPDNVSIPDIPGLHFSTVPPLPTTNTPYPTTCVIQEKSNDTLPSDQPTLAVSTCEPITEAIPICINVEWTNATFPNLCGHTTQAEAYAELDDIIPLIEKECSNKLVHLLCAVYAPMCVQSNSLNHGSFVTLAPCKQLCEFVRADCEPFLNDTGLLWPSHLDCDNFPTTGACVNVPDNVTIPDIPGLSLATVSTAITNMNGSMVTSTTATGNTVPDHFSAATSQPTASNKNATCQPITPTASICTDVGWDFVCFPNLHGHDTQEEAMAKLGEFIPLIDQSCSNKLVYLLCATYMPQCHPDQQCPGDLGPCKELCEYVRCDCKSVLESNASWSSLPECSNYSSNAVGQCIDVPQTVSSALSVVNISLLCFFLTLLATFETVP